MRHLASIAVGFALAAALGIGAVWLHAALFPLPPAEASGGMAAFGDFILFVGVFTVAAIFPTIRLLKLLHGSPLFWSACSVAAVLVTMTGIVAGATYLLPGLRNQEELAAVLMFAPLRILGAFPLSIASALAGVVAPRKTESKILLGCASLEALIFIAAIFRIVVS